LTKGPSAEASEKKSLAFFYARWQPLTPAYSPAAHGIDGRAEAPK